ncbi:MAG: hypothetical protein ACKVG9_00080 [Rhodospirillales bacterium]|tara:strand:+ start:570 stop:872 length:303 start_codon:yes stop_codon:yes gene_type:complete
MNDVQGTSKKDIGFSSQRIQMDPFEEAFPAKDRLARLQSEIPIQLKNLARLSANTRTTVKALQNSGLATRDHLLVAVEHQVEAIHEMVLELEIFMEIEGQ